MAAGAEQLFRFQFSAYAIELPSTSTCSEECKNVTLAFRLFDFPSVLLHLQRPPASVEALLVEHSPERSGVERCRVRGGKSCLFSMSIEQLKYLSETSQLYVMLTRLRSASSGGQDAADGHLLAASTVSLQTLVETCLAEATSPRHKHSVSLYRGSQLYAKAHVTLSLQRVQLQAASEERGAQGGSAGVYSRGDGVTEQSNRVWGVVGAHQQAEGLSHVVGPPAMLFRAGGPKHQPTTQEVFSGVKTSLVSNVDPVPAETCSSSNTGRRTVWPNGYVEEVVSDEAVLAAVDPLPTTSEAHITSSLKDSRYPILQALLKELYNIKSHSLQFQKHHADVVAPKLSDKCLQTEECPEASSPPASGHVQHRASKPSPQRPFVRTCCAIKHVPGEWETAVKKLRQAKPLQTPLQSKAEVFPLDNHHPIASTEGQPETSDSLQLPASAATPLSEGGVGVAGVPEVEVSTPLYTKMPTAGYTTMEASSELIRINSHQGLSPVREGDSRDDRSSNRHVDSRVDRSESNVDSRVDRSDTHVDSRVDRSDTHVDSRVDRSNTHVDSRVDRSDTHVDSRVDRSSYSSHADSRDHRSDSRSYKSDRQVDRRDHKSDRHADSSEYRKDHTSGGHSSADNISAAAQCASTHHPPPQTRHSIDSNTSISSGIHPTNEHTHVRENSDSAAVAHRVHSSSGGEQPNESLHPPSSPHVSRHDVSEDHVRSSTGYSVDSLEEGRSVDTPTGLSSQLRDSYTEDFESGSDFSQDRNPVSNSDWNQGMIYSPVPVDEGASASDSTASTSSSTVHTTDQ